MKTFLTRVSALFAMTMLAAMPLAVGAQAQNPFINAQQQAQQVGDSGGITTQQDLPAIIGRIINIVLGFLGIVLLLIILYAGFMWMTAGGDSGKTEEARTWIANAVIGLIIIVAAYAISNFVLASLVNVTQ